MYSCEYGKIFKSIYFAEHLWTTLSTLSLQEQITQ